MSSILERISDYLVLGGLFNPERANHTAVRDLIMDCRNEIKRLEKYEKLVQYIANDYHELSYDKSQWQRDYWKKKCKNLIEKDFD